MLESEAEIAFGSLSHLSRSEQLQRRAVSPLPASKAESAEQQNSLLRSFCIGAHTSRSEHAAVCALRGAMMLRAVHLSASHGVGSPNQSPCTRTRRSRDTLDVHV